MENINIIIDTVQQKLIRKIFSHLMGDILINSNIIEAIKLSPEEVDEIIKGKPNKKKIKVKKIITVKKKKSKISETDYNSEAVVGEVAESVVESVIDSENETNSTSSSSESSGETIKEESASNFYRNERIPSDIEPENWRYDDILYLVDKRTNYVYCRKENKLLGIRSFNEDREVYYIDDIEEET